MDAIGKNGLGEYHGTTPQILEEENRKRIVSWNGVNKASA